MTFLLVDQRFTMTEGVVVKPLTLKGISNDLEVETSPCFENRFIID